jgi:hypothetical protein
MTSENIYINWTWILVGFCFYIVFHLFPTYTILSFPTIKPNGILTILFIGVSAIGVISGYLSEKKIYIESGIAALLYTLLIVILLNTLFNEKSSYPNYELFHLVNQSISFYIFIMLGSFALAGIGSWIGDKIKGKV